MRKQQFNSWEEILIYAGISEASEIDVSSVPCDTWGPRIATTLLEDLSEEERCDLAEHVKTCSACSAHLREYQQLEEDAKRLPSYIRSQYTALHSEEWSRAHFSRFLQRREQAKRKSKQPNKARKRLKKVQGNGGRILLTFLCAPCTLPRKVSKQSTTFVKATRTLVAQLTAGALAKRR